MTKRTFFLSCVLIILISIASFSIEKSGADDEGDSPSISIQSLFPLSQDLSWRYERISRDGVSHYVTRYMGTLVRENETLYILGNPYGSSFYSRDQTSLRVKGLADAEDIKKVFFYQEGDIIRLKYPLEPGNRWRGSAVMEKAEEIIVTAYDTEILGWQKVETPAGVFDSLVTSSTQHALFIKRESGQGKGMFTSEQIWYSPNLGIVRRDLRFLYPGNVSVPYRDDRLTEFKREKKKQD